MAGKQIVRQEDSVQLMDKDHKALKEVGTVCPRANVATGVLTKTSAGGCQLLRLQTKPWGWGFHNNKREQLN